MAHLTSQPELIYNIFSEMRTVLPGKCLYRQRVEGCITSLTAACAEFVQPGSPTPPAGDQSTGSRVEKDPSKNIGQLIWGAALLLAGIGVFIRIPQVMPKIAEIEQFAGVTGIIRFCFYFIGIMLIGGGAKKIHANIGRRTTDSADRD
jgi:hypothetical protein